MKHPARRQFHRAPARGVRISGWSGQGTAEQPRKKSNQATGHACSLSTNRRQHNSRSGTEVPRKVKIIFLGRFGRSTPAEAVQQKGRRRSKSSSVPRGDRATPAEAVVHADLDGVLVLP